MNTYTVHASNRPHYITFNVTAKDKDKAGERVIDFLESEGQGQEEYDMQDFSGDAYEVWPREDFDYEISLVEESQHADDLRMIDGGGNG